MNDQPPINNDHVAPGCTPFTTEEVARNDIVDRYIASLNWSPETDDYTRTLVVGNIRGFYAWWCAQPAQTNEDLPVDPDPVDTPADARGGANDPPTK